MSRVASITVALLVSVSPLRAQDAAHVVANDGVPALQFTTGTGVDVLVKRESDTLLFEVITAHYINGKGGDICFGTIAISKTNVSFRPDRGNVPKKCRALAEKAPLLTQLRNARLARGTRNTPGMPTLGVEFQAGDTEYLAWLPPLLKCETCGVAPYEYLVLALTVPDSAFARFEKTTAASAVPQGRAESEAAKLYEQFFNQRRTDPDAAYVAAKVYLERMKGEPSSPDLDFARQWIAAYEKVKKQ